MIAPAIVEPKPLDAPQLQEIAESIRVRIRRTVENIIETGRDLTRVKTALDHGEFGEWIESEFGMTIRTAQNYIRAAEWAEGKNEIVSLLPPSTLYLLSAKSTPEEIRAEVVSDLKAGKPVELPRVKQQINTARIARRDATQAKQRNQRRSKAAVQRRERQAQKREAEMQERKAREEQATSEIISILRKLGRADLDRLTELFEVVQTWQVREGLTRALEPLSERQWAVPSTLKSGAG